MHGTVTEAIERATLEVFAIMVGVDLVPKVQWKNTGGEFGSNVESSFQLSGAVSGTAMVYYTLTLATRITCQLLRIDPPVPETDILDAAGEVANMIVGSVKNLLECHWGSIRIGVPRVVLSGQRMDESRGMRVSFRCYDDVFTVSVVFHEDPSHWEN